ncbi:MAG: hypothetical protein CMJ20_04375 [Phycisphaeraceae bacterium]|nr:hypothetical protein [Phycisphaeraceae bacterium]
MVGRYDQQALLDYLEGDLGIDARRRFEEQLWLDGPLRKLVNQMVQDRQQLRQTPQVQPPLDLLCEAQEQINQHLERQLLLSEVPSGTELRRHQGDYKRLWICSGIAVIVIISVSVYFLVGLNPFASSTTAGDESLLVSQHGQVEPPVYPLPDGPVVGVVVSRVDQEKSKSRASDGSRKMQPVVGAALGGTQLDRVEGTASIRLDSTVKQESHEDVVPDKPIGSPSLDAEYLAAVSSLVTRSFLELVEIESHTTSVLAMHANPPQAVAWQLVLTGASTRKCLATLREFANHSKQARLSVVEPFRVEVSGASCRIVDDEDGAPIPEVSAATDLLTVVTEKSYPGSSQIAGYQLSVVDYEGRGYVLHVRGDQIQSMLEFLNASGDQSASLQPIGHLPHTDSVKLFLAPANHSRGPVDGMRQSWYEKLPAENQVDIVFDWSFLPDWQPLRDPVLRLFNMEVEVALRVIINELPVEKNRVNADVMVIQESGVEGKREHQELVVE